MSNIITNITTPVAEDKNLRGTLFLLKTNPARADKTIIRNICNILRQR
ncbi:hypothetical protein BN938_0862 [Mucinivorans hirudinis]|uniref:Uncharacterized protein n=1 Tax=Mucinivorans hirudinis TaxID=1433126 RepID=A0A060RB12_9BACT|nr:hypothetical protein BN938_0862 [Mucinivorans hirudinis]